MPHLFADLTALLEDLHEVAMRGQRAGQPSHAQESLLEAMREGLERAYRIMLDITLALP